MADADPLIDALRAGGAQSGGGAFTLDAARARAKLREFQLADPHRYILLLVQAMAQRGATHIEVVIDANDTVMTSDAAPLTFEELQDLYMLLFAATPPPAGLRELALACNAAMATDPRWVRVECRGPDGSSDGVRLEQRNDAEDRVDRVAGLTAGMRVHVRERFGLGIVRRFFAAGSDAIREQAVLRHGCRFSTLPLLLSGEPLLRESADDAVRAWHDVTHDGRRIGELGLSAAGTRGRLELVRHHVWLTTHALDEPRLVGVRGVVDVSHLRTDASMTDVVRDDEFAAVLHAVRSTHDVALSAACRRHPAGDGVLAGLVREALCHRIGAHLAEADAELGTLATPGGPSRWRFESEPLRDFLRVSLWSTVGGERRSSAELLARGPVHHSAVEIHPTPPEFADIVFAKGRAETLLRAAFPGRTVDYGNYVRRTATREANRAALDERLHSVILPSRGNYDFIAPFSAPSVEGVIGWSAAAGASWIRVILRERLLVQIPVEPEFGTIHVAVSAAFTPTDMLDDAMRDAAFAAAMHAVLVAHGGVFDVVCSRLLATERPPDRTALGLAQYVLGTHDDTHATRWLATVGLTDAEARELLDRRGRPWRRDVAAIAAGTIDHPLATLHLFTDAAGGPVNLRRVAAELAEGGTIGIITNARPKLRDPPEFVVRVGDVRLALLQLAFGAHRLRKVGRDYERWLAREAVPTRSMPATLEAELHADVPVPDPVPVPVPVPDPVPVHSSDPSPHARLRARIVAELRLLHHREHAPPTESYLDLLTVEARDGSHVARRDGDRVVVDAAHPIVARAAEDHRSPLLVGIVASSALSALNFALDPFTDGDEARLLRIHAQHLLAACDAPSRD